MANEDRQYHHHLMNRIGEELITEDDQFLLMVFDFIREQKNKDHYIIPGCMGNTKPSFQMNIKTPIKGEN